MVCLCSEKASRRKTAEITSGSENIDVLFNCFSLVKLIPLGFGMLGWAKQGSGVWYVSAQYACVSIPKCPQTHAPPCKVNKMWSIQKLHFHKNVVFHLQRAVEQHFTVMR